MHSNLRSQLVVILAGLLGVVVGQVLRERIRSGKITAEDAFSGIDVQTVQATPALAAIAIETLGVDDDENIMLQAAFSFATGAVLTLAADTIGKRLPGVLPAGDAAEG
jgi:hypothetical protein